MVKKLFALAAAVVLVACMGSVALADACTCGDYRVRMSQDATCGVDGFTVYKCNVCGQQWTVSAPATNDHNYVDGTCTECGQWLCFNGHSYEVVKTEPATCESKAYVWKECSVCGKETSGEEGELADHDYVNGECTVCGAADPDYVLEECTHETTYTDTVEATCAKEGTKKVICKDCGETVSEETLPKTECVIFIDGVCRVCGATEETEECTHETTYTDTVEATCAKEGTKKVMCKDCGETVSEETLPKTECVIFIDGVCRVCGATEEVECEHNYVVTNEEPATCQYAAYVWYECSECGAEKSGEEGEPDPDAHTYVDGVCACGAEEPKTECAHENTKLDIVESTCAVKGTKKVICKDCDETISTEELPLTECAIYIDGVCKVCGKTEETEECAHENTKLDIVESTCAVKGTKKVICKDCDETISTEELPLTECAIYIDGVCRVCGAEEPVECEHNYEIVKEEAATCTVPGYVWTKCTVCGDEQNGETAVDADNHVNTKVHIVEATCAVTGTCTTICKDCDKELSMEILPLTDCAVFVDGVCRVCGAVEAPCAHENTKVDIVEATCAVTGTKKVICKDCDEVVSEEVLPLTDCVIYIDGVCRVCGAVEAPCAHENTKFDIIEATCAKEGIEKVICKDCDEVISETVLPLTDCAIFVDGVCKLCGAVENTECEHNYETVKELAPNCTEAGYVWQECTICGAEKNFEVGEPNGEHNYATVKELAPNCVEAGYVWTACTICGAEKNYEVGEPNGEHTYEIVKELAPTCVEAGYVWEVCSVCGAEHNHEVGEATGEHTYETVVDLAPTCTTPGEQHDVCTVCGAETEAEMIPATDHQDIELAYDEDDHWIYCDDCDEVLASEGHEFTYWTANGYKHAACDCGYETSWKVQTGELDGLPKTGDR